MPANVTLPLKHAQLIINALAAELDKTQTALADYAHAAEVKAESFVAAAPADKPAE